MEAVAVRIAFSHTFEGFTPSDRHEMLGHRVASHFYPHYLDLIEQMQTVRVANPDGGIIENEYYRGVYGYGSPGRPMLKCTHGEWADPVDGSRWGYVLVPGRGNSPYVWLDLYPR